MTLNPATRLGPYEILAPMGAGEMGEVYLAMTPVSIATSSILSLAPFDINSRGFSISRDDRAIFSSVAITSAAIRMSTFDAAQ